MKMKTASVQNPELQMAANFPKGLSKEANEREEKWLREFRERKALAERLAGKLSKKDAAELEQIKAHIKKLGRSLKKKHPAAMRRISLKLFWEYEPTIWSDCPHHDELKGAIEEREQEKSWKRASPKKVLR